MGSAVFTEVPVVFTLQTDASGDSSRGNKTLVGEISSTSIKFRVFESALAEGTCACGKDHFG